MHVLETLMTMVKEETKFENAIDKCYEPNTDKPVKHSNYLNT